MKKIKCDSEENINGNELSPVIPDSQELCKSTLATGRFCFANTISSFHLRPKKGLDK